MRIQLRPCWEVGYVVMGVLVLAFILYVTQPSGHGEAPVTVQTPDHPAAASCFAQIRARLYYCPDGFAYGVDNSVWGRIGPLTPTAVVPKN